MLRRPDDDVRATLDVSFPRTRVLSLSQVRLSVGTGCWLVDALSLHSNLGLFRKSRQGLKAIGDDQNIPSPSCGSPLSLEACGPLSKLVFVCRIILGRH